MSSFIPPGAGVDLHVLGQLLLSIKKETVFLSALSAMSLDRGLRIPSFKKRINSLAIAAHVGMVDIREKTHRRLVRAPDGRLHLNLKILCVRPAHVPISIDSV